MIDAAIDHRCGGVRALALVVVVGLSGCAADGPVVTRVASPETRLPPEVFQMYGQVDDGEFIIPAVPPPALSERNVRQVVDYWADEEPGTIVVDPGAKFLYYVLGGNQAIRYGIAVGEQGYGFTGRATVPVKREWPSWTPTQNMIRRDPEQYGPWAGGMQGGLANPLGARALYLYQNGRDTMYRIHGTNDVFSIGRATSAGCIRLYNQDSLHLYERVDLGTRVVVLPESEAGRWALPPFESMATLDQTVSGQ
jgi:lipoprotein-anchoring transpeptidase ErfK/SrfK